MRRFLAILFARSRAHWRPASLILALALALNAASTASARLVTFYFEAALPFSALPFYPFPIGQRASGYYTFELDTPPSTSPGPNRFTRYDGAVKDVSLTLDGFGIATGTTGDILLGDPVQTTGSYNFLSDQYRMQAPVSGISISTHSGVRQVLSASIAMKDLDMVGLDSEILLDTPPRLKYFLDHHGPNYDSDNAELYIAIGTPGGPYGSLPFRLTKLTVPEPSAAALLLAAVFLSFSSRVRLPRQPRAS